ERGANGASGMQHVVDEDNVAAVEIGVDLRRADARVQADAGEVVAVKADVKAPQRGADAQRLVQPFGDPDAAGMNADHDHVRRRAYFRFQCRGQTRQRLFDVDGGKVGAAHGVSVWL